MNREENSNTIIKRRSIKESSNQVSLNDLLEGEKAIRYLQNKCNIEEMKAKVLKQKIEQKKKAIDTVRMEVKKLKMNGEKNKENIALLQRDSAFLKEMIDFLLNKIK